MPQNLSPSGGHAQLRRKGSDNGMKLAVILMVVSLVLFTLSGREDGSGPLTSVREGFQFITTPVRIVGAAATQPFQGLSNALTNLTADQETLSALTSEN